MDSPEALTLLGVTLFLAALVGTLIFAIARLRRGQARQRRRHRRAEQAFLAATLEEVRVERERSASPAAPGHATSPLDAAIVDALPTPLMVVDEAGLLRRFNHAAGALLDMKVARPLPAPARHALAAHPSIVQAVDAARLSIGPSTTLVDLAGADTWRTIEVAWSPLPSAEGKRLLVSLRDVSAGQERESILRRRETMSQVAQLGSSVAHELANSLTAVHGYARMIDGSMLTPTDRASLEAIQKETNVLTMTIESFRRVTRPLELSREAVAVRWLADDAVKQVAAEHQLAPGDIVTRVPDTLQVQADRVLLEEALTHVLANAIEASRAAGATPLASISADRSADGTSLQLVVEDHGAGVPEADLSQLFMLFFTTKTDRVGSGLARARHIVHSHDGSISASPASSGGLRVTITLPLSGTATAPSAPR